MSTDPPFALFVLVELENHTINQLLVDAYTAVGAEHIWLATDNYEHAPRKQPRHANLGTKLPIDGKWKSPWIGSAVEEAAEWLKQKPDYVDIDGYYFFMLDEKAATDGKVAIVRIGDSKHKGDSLSFLRREIGDAINYLVGLEPCDWPDGV